MTTVYKLLYRGRYSLRSAMIPGYEDNCINYIVDEPIINRRVFCFDTLEHAKDFQWCLISCYEIWIAEAKDPKPIKIICDVIHASLFKEFWESGLKDFYLRTTPLGTLITDHFILRKEAS